MLWSSTGGARGASVGVARRGVSQSKAAGQAEMTSTVEGGVLELTLGQGSGG